MKLRNYLASKAVFLCFIGIALIAWGVFAYLTGANAILLWGSEAFFLIVVIARYTAGYFIADKRLNRLHKTIDELHDKYLIGEVLEKPHDSVEREYFEVMKTVSRSAIGAVENAEKEKTDYCDFVESWIHELKTPLTACSLICDNGADKQKLKHELKRADNIADTALYYARLRTPQNDNVITRVNLREVVDGAIKSQRELLTAAKISLDVDGEFFAHTDGKSIAFVLKQLFINCAKYCPACHIEIKLEDGVIRVADNGPGIASHELPRITQRGFTGEAGRKIGSTGMGLYIASETCKRLSVDFSVQSEYGVGTEFSLAFENYEKN